MKIKNIFLKSLFIMCSIAFTSVSYAADTPLEIGDFSKINFDASTLMYDGGNYRIINPSECGVGEHKDFTTLTPGCDFKVDLSGNKSYIGHCKKNEPPTMDSCTARPYP